MISKKKRAFIAAGALFLCAFFLLIILQESAPLQEQPNKEVALRAKVEDVSIDDMMNNLEKRKSPASLEELPPSGDKPIESSIKDDPEQIARLQALIRQNEENMQNGVSEIENERKGIVSNVAANSSPASSVPRKKQEAVKKDTVVVETPKKVNEKRSPFNSISFSSNSKKNAIKAYVHSEQTVMVGSTLKMRLGEDAIADNDVVIPKNSPVFGEVTSIDGERVNVKITHINYQGNILPFNKLVFSKDALLGIYVPGNPKSEVNKDAVGGALDGLPTSGIPGVDAATQLAGAVASSALSAGKQAVSKNVKKIKVTIKTNYEIYLRPDEKNL